LSINFAMVVAATGGVDQYFNGLLGPLLGTITLPSSSIPLAPNALPPVGAASAFSLSIDLTSLDVFVAAGQLYAIAETPTAVSSPAIIMNGMSWVSSVAAGTTDNYTQGYAFRVFSDTFGSGTRISGSLSPNLDLGFRTYVSPIPEPDAIALMLAGATVVASAALRARRQ
jgi:hypothetical protein